MNLCRATLVHTIDGKIVNIDCEAIK